MKGVKGMKERDGRGGPAPWSAVIWVAGPSAVLVALPWAASGRLPERLATHWSGGSGAPDGSMPLWAAALFPALVWAVLALLTVTLVRPRGGAAAYVALPVGAVFLVGAQAGVVRANLDRADWHQAGSVDLALAVTIAVAAVAGPAGWLATRNRSTPAARPADTAPGMEIPAGQTLVWLSRTANPWLRALAVLTGAGALAAALAAVAGLVAPPWALLAPLAIASVTVLACSSVRARVSERGLEVAFGPLGLPVRRWDAGDIESAHAEHRTPAQVGGWGYRLSGKGATVMLRAGECLVIHPRRGADFAVSVGDAERGAALLNSLIARASR
ncbi:DUF1648 domain-containing protein [Streptomyces sp. C]|uniref:DUF1648 domain-containing protein n=1 Tax=Streptomyces sp. C TaxID=253839 RepID=UPI0001B556F9|nr:DUF1648 domain-containing protein [Streptomyces sp. C]EFL13158.1 conserved hypothetical protein [Streptomyces sp. C]